MIKYTLAAFTLLILTSCELFPFPNPTSCTRELIICDDGSNAVDLDGDGCPQECEDRICESDEQCDLGERCVFNDIATRPSEPAGAPAFERDIAAFGQCLSFCEDIFCAESEPIDSNGDGCTDTCEAQCPDFAFCEGAYDSTGDGCLDTCPPQECPELLGDCPAGSEFIDSNDDGCFDSCSETQSCYSDSECGEEERCDTENYCDPDPSCTGDDPCPPVCAGRCLPLADDCRAIPVCDEGDVQIESVNECGEICYTRTTCNTTILCTN